MNITIYTMVDAVLLDDEGDPVSDEVIKLPAGSYRLRSGFYTNKDDESGTYRAWLSPFGDDERAYEARGLKPA